MTILVTGGAGFIGSHFIRYMLNRYNYTIVNLDALTYAGNLDNLIDIDEDSHYNFIKGNITDKKLLAQIFQQYNIDAVINFAAETHVDRSIEAPSIFLETNILGTQALLEVSKENWTVDHNVDGQPVYLKGKKFVQISTDEVYGALDETGSFTEETPLAPNSPYSASKAGADLLVMSYYKTYNLPVNITRCSNNYGPNQYPEKLIPLMIKKCIAGENLPVYGDGMNVRDWLYVEDHCSAIDLVLHRGHKGEIYNIGDSNEKTNLEIVSNILEAFEKDQSCITFVADRLGHDRRYSIDSHKIQEDLNWQPRHQFRDAFAQTIEWYRQYFNLKML